MRMTSLPASARSSQAPQITSPLVGEVEHSSGEGDDVFNFDIFVRFVLRPCWLWHS
jgi:hypothetical protein